MKELSTLQQAIVYFSDPDRAFQYALNFRWPDGLVTCPRCGSEKHSFIKTRKVWFCYPCKKQFSLKIGTIFEDSPISLDKWMLAMWMLANCRNGVSSYELGRTIGVMQRSAWFMLHRIREAMKVDFEAQPPIGNSGNNPVEIDETYVGGKPKNRHSKKRSEIGDKKAIVMGMLTRNTREVRARVIPNVKRETLQAEILKHVGWGSVIYTDQHVGYDELNKLESFTHKTVNHMTEYVNGRVHTQGIENFWSLLKRSLNGTYVAVEPFHLDAYGDEQVFRYNNRRNKTDEQRLQKVLSQVSGKRLTYSDLTGAGSATSL
jgi:transposase-like protein